MVCGAIVCCKWYHKGWQIPRFVMLVLVGRVFGSYGEFEGIVGSWLRGSILVAHM